MTIGNRIADIRFRLELTQAQLGELLEVHEASIRRWEKDNSIPKPPVLSKIAELGGVSVDWLLGREKPEGDLEELLRRQNQQIERWMEEQGNQGNIIEVAAEDFVMVPVVGRVSAGDGTPTEEDIEEYLPVPKQDIPAGCTPFFVRVVGNCMERTAGIREGDLVFVAKGLEVNDGDLVIATVDGEAKVKRLKRTGDQAMLISDDPDEPISPADDVEIAGPVLWSRRYHRRI